MKVEVGYIERLVRSKLRKLGFSAAEARLIGDEYIQGELQGNDSHGLVGFAGSFKKKKPLLKKRGHFSVTQRGRSYLYLKGNRDLGQVAADYAVREGVKMAKKSGIAMVGCGNVHSFMRPGTWAQKAAERDTIAICLNYGGAPKVAPTGAREAVLATNPIGIGIPYRSFPIVIDMATSHRAFWFVKRAKKFHEKLERGLAMDKEGRMTLDPFQVAALNPMGGYKGYALGLAFELLTGPFVKTKVGKRTRKVRGFVFIFINPYLFNSKRAFQSDVDALVKEVTSARKARRSDGPRIPGERAYAQESKARIRGWFNLDDRILKEIQAL